MHCHHRSPVSSVRTSLLVLSGWKQVLENTKKIGILSQVLETSADSHPCSIQRAVPGAGILAGCD